MTATECPKCHYVKTESDTVPDWQCPNCGIAYTKFTRQAHPPELEVKKNTKQKLPLKTVSDTSLGITFVLVAIKYLIDRINIGDAMMAIIIYMSAVPVLSVLFGDGLYMWNKKAMRFELYQNGSTWFVMFLKGVNFLSLIGMTILFFLSAPHR